MRLIKPARQPQTLLDERQRGVLLSSAQEDTGLHGQHVSNQVVVSCGPGDGQCFLAVFLRDRVAARLLQKVSGCCEARAWPDVVAWVVGTSSSPRRASTPSVAWPRAFQNVRSDATSRMPGAGSGCFRL